MSVATKKYGTEEGEVCGRRGCDGVIEIKMPDDGSCSCHISPPCSYCTSSTFACPKCGWVATDDRIFNDYIVNIDPKTGIHRTSTLRPLDPTKIDWYSKTHTRSSMIKEGVCPPGTTRLEVLQTIGPGTFGGRFEYFDETNGKFKYIAYTD